MTVVCKLHVVVEFYCITPSRRAWGR